MPIIEKLFLEPEVVVFSKPISMALLVSVVLVSVAPADTAELPGADAKLAFMGFSGTY